VGFVVDKVVLGQVFSEYFGFPCTIFIPPISPQSPSPIIRGWYSSGRSTKRLGLTPLRIKKKGIFPSFFLFISKFSSFLLLYCPLFLACGRIMAKSCLHILACVL
jgi:hypothetical protein